MRTVKRAVYIIIVENKHGDANYMENMRLWLDLSNYFNAA